MLRKNSLLQFRHNINRFDLKFTIGQLFLFQFMASSDPEVPGAN
jgi:hypothetical protein